MSKSSAILSQLCSARIDGRTENVRYRQTSLQRLHGALAAKRDEIQNAIVKDAGYSAAEAAVEFSLTMEALRHHYDSLDFDQLHKDEYQVTHGRDYSDRCIGVGIVLIKPCSVSPLYSALAPISAAMAAGNCILLEVQQLETNLQVLPALLRQIISSCLDGEAFAVIDSSIDQQLSLACDMLVLQTNENEFRKAPESQVPVLQSPSRTCTIAVVDRTADIANAAKILVAARMAFGGKSPYAPDLVLVNEFVKKRFLEAAAQETIAYIDYSYAAQVNFHAEKSRSAQETRLRERFTKAATEGLANIVTLAPHGCIVDVTSRKSTLLASKIDIPLLPVLSVSSLDDAINFANLDRESGPSTWQKPPPSYLASFIFGSPAAAKYLAQFISARASFLNTIPFELLVGPAAPASGSHPLSVDLRYTKTMFETARPHFVTKSPRTELITSALSSSGGASIAEMTAAAVKPLTPTNQPFQARHIGFFEQGILTGLGMFLVPVLAGLGFGGYYASKHVWAMLR